jgi:PAS domain S-box-containing protein
MPEDNGFFKRVASPRFCVRLFAHLPDVVFCMKDANRRYQAANIAFAARLGLDHPARLLGKTAEDFFPAPLAGAYREQDEMVLATGRELSDRLELITNRDGSLGWYLATKVPLHDAGGRIIGLASISRDLATPREEDLEFSGVLRVVRHVQRHPDEDLRPAALAAMAGLSPAQLDRRIRRVFQLSTAAFIRKTRIGHAAQLLTTTRQPIAGIALACGYGDQSAFTRQFRATVGLPPAAYRAHSGNHE